MTKTQVYQPSTAQHQPPAMPCARWTQQHHALTLPLSPYARAGQGAQPAPRLETGARSLHGVKVAAHVGDGHPAANWDGFGLVVRKVNADNLNQAVFNLCGDLRIGQSGAGGKSGGLDLEKYVHGVAPVDALNIAQDALITTTVRRKVGAA